MTHLLDRLRALLRREDGNATIEFVLWFPFFVALFGSSIEASLVSTRQALLVSAVDRTVRDLQLGNLGNPTHSELKAHICNLAGFIPNCLTAMNIEQERLSPDDNFTFRTGEVGCIDVDEPEELDTDFDPGVTSNDLMLITVCAAFQPMTPITGLGLKLPKIKGGSYYGLTAFSAYVVEPS